MDSSSITDYEKARRSGGRKYHPKSEAIMSGPSFWEKVKPYFLPTSLGILAVFAAIYTFKLINSNDPRKVVVDDVAGIALEFKSSLERIESLVIDISEQVIANTRAIEELREEPVVNPDLPIIVEPETIVKWKTRWKTRWKTKVVEKLVTKWKTNTVYTANPINAELRDENRRLRQRAMSYNLKAKMINDFYSHDLPPGEKARLIYSKSCGGI